MPDESHIEIFEQGVEVWNRWRKENRKVEPDLSGADLSQRKLRGINLSSANLRGMNLSGADLTEADLGGSDLRDSNLIGADLHSASLYCTSLVGADLTRTELSYVDFTGAWFGNVNLTEAQMGYSRLDNNDLSEVVGLETVKHDSPSSIGIDTIYESKGNIPEVFLRGAGVPENFIKYMASLTGQAFQFYKCFISFTESDDLFSQRLYNDLQAAGVRCWRWKEDAKWGRSLMRSIDEAVRLYDKLVVICSDQSLNSPAVIHEIERALQKEDELGRERKENEVLFPIRLDDYIFDGWNHYRKADVVAKNIGDFRAWKEPEAYQIALNRLIRDLKTEMAGRDRA
jgi:uncharacterized protein YjbI with pentapeptide repeats